MTARFDLSVIGDLLAPRRGPCLSLYLDFGTGAVTVRARSRALLQRAQPQLVAAGLADDEATALLDAVRSRIEEWVEAPGDPAAVFLAAPGFTRGFHTPLPLRDGVMVGARFYLRPLLPVLAQADRYYVLALSLNHVRLIESHGGHVRHLPLGELEGGLAAMGWEYERTLQVHSASPVGRGSHKGGIVHGHGDAGERSGEEDIRQFFRRVADAVKKLHLDPRAPRVLATTRTHAALYLGISRDRMLLDEPLLGNPDRQSDAELAHRAADLVATAQRREREQALGQCRELLGGPRATGDVSTVLRLARQERVQTLFLPAAAELWGRWDERTGRVDLHASRQPADEELLERAALETLVGGGTVYELSQAAAIDGAPLTALLKR